MPRSWRRRTRGPPTSPALQWPGPHDLPLRQHGPKREPIIGETNWTSVCMACVTLANTWARL
eukprot:scaffold327428_cov50-Prasinocladus_malaysianus.AAC.1